jgi:hypothetical protein
MHDILSAGEFRLGVCIGGILTGIVFVAAADRRPRVVVPIGGVLVAGGFAVGLAHSGTVRASLVVGAALLALAGYFADRLRLHLVVAAAFALPGALLLALDLGAPPAAWIAPVSVIAVACASPLVADFDRRFAPDGWTAALYAISVLGVYFTVPDTERALVLLGVAIPLVFLAWPVMLAPFGSAGSFAAVGMLVWVAAYECRGREASLIGAIGCLGLLVVEPLARAAGRGSDTVIAALPRRQWSVLPVGALQLALVYVASRVAGLRTSVAEATLIVAFELAVAIAVLCRGYVRASP